MLSFLCKDGIRPTMTGTAGWGGGTIQKDEMVR
jgi:hypothetical protein